MAAAHFDAGRIEFVRDYEQLLKHWPSDVKWPLTAIAGEMARPVPFVVNILTELTDRELDIHDPISYREADRILTIIKQRLRPEIELFELQRLKLREKIKNDYTSLAGKIRDLCKVKNWHSAYRTLSYFAGQHQNNMDPELFVSICDECLRLGQKAGINHQELGIWLRKSVSYGVREASVDAFEDTLDLIEVYAPYFLEDSSGGGERLVASILGSLTRTAVELAMVDRLREFCQGLDIELELFGSRNR